MIHARNEDGVGLSDLEDHFNEPRAITHDQSDNRAYAIAAKVWGQVKACQTFHDAMSVLSDAGCRLHYYCAMD